MYYSFFNAYSVTMNVNATVTVSPIPNATRYPIITTPFLIFEHKNNGLIVI